MPRSRNIKPGFYKNEDLAECSIWARFIYPGLWMIADREGRLEDRPKRIKAELLPMDSQEVEPLLAELAERGFIVRYVVAGKAVIWIPTFHKHQNPHHREQLSELPPPPSPGLNTDANGEKPRALDSMGPMPEASPPLQGGPAVLNPSSLNPDSLFSESMPTDADAPPAPPTSPVLQKTEGMTMAEQRKAEAWNAVKSMLKAHGMPMAQTGSFLGKLAKDYGDDLLVDVMEAAVVKRPADPAAWITRACQNSVGQRKTASRHGRQADFSQIDYGGHDGTTIPA